MQRSIALGRVPFQQVRAVAPSTPTTRRSADRRSKSNNPLINKLYRRFKVHTANFVGNVANNQLQNAASGIANACVSLIPASNSFPALNLLARELAKRLVRHTRSKNRVTALVRTCGPQQSAILLAISIVTFLHGLAQQLGSPMTLEDVATLLLDHVPLIAGFVTGKNVNVLPILEELLPRRRKT